jgi:hypothetical protein
LSSNDESLIISTDSPRKGGIWNNGAMMKYSETWKTSKIWSFWVRSIVSGMTGGTKSIWNGRITFDSYCMRILLKMSTEYHPSATGSLSASWIPTFHAPWKFPPPNTSWSKTPRWQ